MLPRENLAQIYSSGNNEDKGFFGRYYKLGPRDRWLGSLFYGVKTAAYENLMLKTSVLPSSSITGQKKASIKSTIKSLIVDTGLYELIFRPRLAKAMLAI